MKGGKFIPRSVLKSGIKLPVNERSKSASIPADLNCSIATGGSGPTPQEEIQACKSFSNVTGNLFVKKDKGNPLSPVVKHRIELEITCEKKADRSKVPDPRELVRHELNAVLKGTSEATVSPRKILKDPVSRIVSFSGKVEVEDSQPEDVNGKEIEKEDEVKDENVVDGPETPETPTPAQPVSKVQTKPTLVDTCQRCSSQVYPFEKLQPSPGQFYHEHCFRCATCNTKLSLVTYCKNLQMTQDPKVYCRPHQPRLDKVKLVKWITRDWNVNSNSWFQSFSLDTSTLVIANALKNSKEMKLQPYHLQPAGRVGRCDSYGSRYF